MCNGGGPNITNHVNYGHDFFLFFFVFFLFNSIIFTLIHQRFTYYIMRKHKTMK